MSTRDANPRDTTSTNEASIIDLAQARCCLARAQRLGHVLGLPVDVDVSGWLRDEVEIVLRRRDAAIVPVAVRVGRDAIDDTLIGPVGVRQLCNQYNTALDSLRGLAARLTMLVRRGRIAVAPGSVMAYAVHELSRLELLIQARQRAYMSHGAIHLGQLRNEIEFFNRYDAHLAPIVEQAASSEDAPRLPHTEMPSEMAPESAPATILSPRPRWSARRWLRWIRWPQRDGAA